MLRYGLFLLLVIALLPLAPYYLNMEGHERVSSARGNSDLERDDYRGRTHRLHRSNGSFFAEARIRGQRLTFLVDTGASQVALPQKEARKLGIFLQPDDFKIPVQTANGVTYAAASNLHELRIGSIRLTDVAVMVLTDEALSTPLLGMSALNKLRRFDFSNDTMVMVQ